MHYNDHHILSIYQESKHTGYIIHVRFISLCHKHALGKQIANWMGFFKIKAHSQSQWKKTIQCIMDRKSLLMLSRP